MTIISLTAIIAILSAVQSLFGVGLLLFGTPTLLILGYSFSSALVILLPCSIAVSLSQLVQRNSSVSNELSFKIIISLITHTIPGVLLGLAFALNEGRSSSIPILVGIALLLSGIIRFSKRMSRLMSTAVKNHQRLFLIITGLVHGFSNMGGGLLVFYAPSVVHGKENVRRVIAAGYALFAAIQLITIFFLQDHFPKKYWMLPVVSLVCFYIFDRAFNRIHGAIYDKLLNAIIVSYGVAALYKAFF